MIEELIQKLLFSSFRSLEICPARTATIEPIIEEIKHQEISLFFDAFVTTDNPLARLKYDSIFASLALQQAFKKPSIATVSMRDKNLLALQSTLLGANDFDIRCFLSLTGDTMKLSDHPEAKAVFNGSSLLLLKAIQSLNDHKSFAGQNLVGHIQPIYPFSVCNSYAKDLKKVRMRIERKLSLGAKAIFTQPVFSLDNAKALKTLFEEAKENTGIKEAALVIGYFPVTSFRTANFLYSKLPGVYIPQEWVSQIQKGYELSPQEEYKIGFDLSKRLFDDINKHCNKIHLMSANNLEVIKSLLN